MRNTRLSFWFASALLVVVGCGPGAGPGGGGDDDGDDTIDGGGGPGFIDARTIDEFPADAGVAMGACSKIDVLFVIDNSGSMGEEQMNLATNFPAFATLVDTYTNSDGALLDYHVGVIVTDKNYSIEIIPGFPIPTGIGHDGKLLEVNGTGGSCNMPRRYLQRGDANFTTILPCVANQGTDGSGNEMPLEATKLALVDRIADGYNSGFLREDALLAIVILTDEDDCSFSASTTTIDPTNMTDCETKPDMVAQYVTAIDGVKGGERARWAVAVISGPPTMACTSMWGGAIATPRIGEFTQMVGANAVFSSICEADLATSLQNAFNKFGEACESFPPVE